MPADVIQVQYDQLSQVASQFGRTAESVAATQQSVQRTAQQLRQGGWAGRGSAAFFAELDGAVSPAMQRLSAALKEAQKVTLQIGFLMRQAEEEASRPFRGNGAAAPVAVADPAVAPLHDPSRDREYLWGLITDEYHYRPAYRPFAGSISPDGISPGDIGQGQLGDCYFLAALASVAQQHPEVIWNAIKDNGDGTFTVTFYQSGKPVAVTVDSEFPVEEDRNGNPTTDPAYARTGSNPQELWPLIMEKAYAQLDGNSYSKIEGGWPGQAVELLTGRPAQRLDLSASDAAQTRLRLEQLQTHLSDGHYLTAATRPERWFENTGGWPSNVVPLHAYSIERVDVEQGLVYLRNPWGSLYAPPPLTLEQFNQYYNVVTVNRSGVP